MVNARWREESAAHEGMGKAGGTHTCPLEAPLGLAGPLPRSRLPLRRQTQERTPL